MYNNDAYYDAPDDGQDQYDQIEAEVDHLMKYENNPYTEDNILEALANDALAPHIQALAYKLQQRDKEAVGTILSAALYTYFEKRSRDQALENLYE